MALELLARRGKCEEAAARIETLVKLIDKFEPRNHALYYQVSLSLARLVRGRGEGGRRMWE